MPRMRTAACAKAWHVLLPRVIKFHGIKNSLTCFSLALWISHWNWCCLQMISKNNTQKQANKKSPKQKRKLLILQEGVLCSSGYNNVFFFQLQKCRVWSGSLISFIMELSNWLNSMRTRLNILERCSQWLMLKGCVPYNARNNVAIQGFAHQGIWFTLADLKFYVTFYISKSMHLFSDHRKTLLIPVAAVKLVSGVWLWSPAADRCCWWSEWGRLFRVPCSPAAGGGGSAWGRRCFGPDPCLRRWCNHWT